jgi:hypothetical protein
MTDRMPKPTMDSSQRAAEFTHLSSDDVGFIAALVFLTYPGVFDAALAELKRRPSGLEEATH